MTVRSPLFEFMPYGAPELLCAERSNLVRALALASLLALTVFLLARALGLAIPDARVIEVDTIDRPSMWIEPPPSILNEPRTQLPQVAPTSAVKDGKLVVVHDEDPVIADDIVMPYDGEIGVGDVTGFDAGAIVPGGPVAFTPEPLPERGEIIYTDELPALAKIVKPEYPDIARDLGIEGRVYVHMLVGKDGRVVRVEVDEKINVPMLNKAAIDAARQWVFQPALVNKHPVAVWVGEAFIFTINR